MKQQIIVSGIGGQGVLFLIRLIAQVAVNRGLAVLTSETHGMAQRGGTVLSTIKVGAFASPLIRAGQADVGLLLWDANLPVHAPLLRDGASLVINAEQSVAGAQAKQCIAASRMARDMGNAVLANLILLGLAIQQQTLFCSAADCVQAIRQLAPERFVDQNLQAFQLGLNHTND
ncbi:MAG: 2-oxoacid:acceptor oxidoreductase family protein [Desulfuromonas sp.]|nr:2-oxoacid:acceptor oxidoreductase family protein [Desulfuromonas sp.]